jgi:hypothetical protein
VRSRCYRRNRQWPSDPDRQFHQRYDPMDTNFGRQTNSEIHRNPARLKKKGRHEISEIDDRSTTCVSLTCSTRTFVVRKLKYGSNSWMTLS